MSESAMSGTRPSLGNTGVKWHWIGFNGTRLIELEPAPWEWLDHKRCWLVNNYFIYPEEAEEAGHFYIEAVKLPDRNKADIALGYHIGTQVMKRAKHNSE